MVCIEAYITSRAGTVALLFIQNSYDTFGGILLKFALILEKRQSFN